MPTFYWMTTNTGRAVVEQNQSRNSSSDIFITLVPFWLPWWPSYTVLFLCTCDIGAGPLLTPSLSPDFNLHRNWATWCIDRSPNSCDCSPHQVCISSYVFHFSLVDRFIDRLTAEPERSHKSTSHKSPTPFQTCLQRPVDQFCWNCFSSSLCGSGSDTYWGAGWTTSAPNKVT